MKASFRPLPDGMVGIRPSGDRAILIELTDLGKVLSLQAQLHENPFDGQVDVVAAASTVLVIADSQLSVRRIAAHIVSMDLGAPPQVDSAMITIETVYDGEDIEAVAGFTGLSRDAVITAHTNQVWSAAFGGFAPGFMYMVGQAGGLEVPRRSSPRTTVPAGSVALAGIYTAVYPRQSPGGWQLIGRTAAEMWNLDREKPALIRPGDSVRFKSVREIITTTAFAPNTRDHGARVKRDVPASDSGKRSGMLVVSPGMQATLQDIGRAGFAHLGVVRSGAMDRGAMRRSNRLVGNRTDAATVEILSGGLVVRAVGDLVIAVTGATVPVTITDPNGMSRQGRMDSPFALMDRETLAMGTPSSGLRSYLAVRGGFTAASTLDSRSTDTMSGIGPDALLRGTFLAIDDAPPHSVVGRPAVDTFDANNEGGQLATVTELRAIPGPRADWFSDRSLNDFFGQQWTVTTQSNRIGLRLAGSPLTRVKPGELPTEGTVCGAVQVPPEGLPVLLLADHPVTIGYPVIAVVVSADLDLAAQLPPGSLIRFIRFVEGPEDFTRVKG